MNRIQEILDKIQDPERKKAFQELLDAEEEARAVVEKQGLRQDEFSRKLDEEREKTAKAETSFADLQRQYGEAVKLNQDWQQFGKDIGWDPETKTTAAERRSAEELAKARERATELETMTESEDGVTFDAIKKYVNGVAADMGFVTKADLGDVVDRKTLNEELQRGLGSWGVGMEKFWAAVDTKVSQFDKDHDTVLNRVALMDHFYEQSKTRGRDYTPLDAFDEFTRETRETAAKQTAEKQEQDIQKRIDDEVAKKVQAEREKLAMGEYGRLPVDVGAPPQGALDQHLRGVTNGKKPDAKEIIDPKDLGKGNLAREFAAEVAKRDAAEDRQ